MTQNAEHGGGNHFVKVEADKSAQPAPEEKTQLFDEKKRNEQGSEQPHDRCSERSVGHDRGDCSCVDCKENLNENDHDGVIRIHAWSSDLGHSVDTLVNPVQ